MKRSGLKELKPQQYQIKLDFFEGPLDLLLHLIEKAEIDIYNIPIALVTDQFLAYLRTMEFLNLHTAGEFLVMAATLMQIKARMLLPRPQIIEDEEVLEEEEDPRHELVERLLEYKKIKEAAQTLRQREEEWRRFYPRSGGSFPDREVAATVEQLGEVSLWDLVGAFQTLLESLVPRVELAGMPEKEESVSEKMEEILQRLSQTPRVLFSSLFSGLKTRKALVTCFLALLELIRGRKVRAVQREIFSDIEIIRWEEE